MTAEDSARRLNAAMSDWHEALTTFGTTARAARWTGERELSRAFLKDAWWIYRQTYNECVLGLHGSSYHFKPLAYPADLPLPGEEL